MPPLIPRARPYFSAAAQERLHHHLRDVLEGWLTAGPLRDRFEARFAAYVGARHAVAVSSGTAALYATLRHFALDGGEVILPTMTCFACASAIQLAGGVPRLVNVAPDSMGLDPADTLAAMGPHTRGVLAVHLGGHILPWIDELRNACRERGLFLVEDAAQATGASLGGRRAGVLADAACFSFHPTKIITTGEGGMITTDDAALAAACRAFRESSVGEDGPRPGLGLNLALAEMACAMGLEQLAELDDFLSARGAVARQYAALLAPVPGVTLLEPPAGSVSSWWRAYVRLPEGVDRDALMQRMLVEHAVDVRPAYRPLLHDHPSLAAGDRGRFAPSDAAMARLVCLPVFVGLTAPDVERVVASLVACLAWPGAHRS